MPNQFPACPNHSLTLASVAFLIFRNTGRFTKMGMVPPLTESNSKEPEVQILHMIGVYSFVTIAAFAYMPTCLFDEPHVAFNQ